MTDTYFDKLAAEALTGTSPTVRPKDASTLIIVDRKGRHPKLLMGRRHAGHRFMPGKFVFPGGRVEDADRRMVAAGALEPKVEERLLMHMQRPSPSRARALALAGIRETFEETGLLLGTKEHGQPEAPENGPWAEFAARGVFPELEPLQFIARAITPPGRTKRFDTRFFAVDATAIAARVEGVVGPDSELVELCWVEMDEAQRLDLPNITRVVVEELRARIAAGMPIWRPVPFFHTRNRKVRRDEL